MQQVRMTQILTLLISLCLSVSGWAQTYAYPDLRTDADCASGTAHTCTIPPGSTSHVIDLPAIPVSINRSDSFERGTGALYAWNTATGCSQQDDAGDCIAPYAPPGFFDFCNHTSRLGFNAAHKWTVVGMNRYGEGCSPLGEVNYWTAGSIDWHGGTRGRWLLLNTSANDALASQSHEMLVSTQPMKGRYPGYLTVEMRWHPHVKRADGSIIVDKTWQANQHIDIASEVSFNRDACSNRRIMSVPAEPISTTCLSTTQERMTHFVLATDIGNVAADGHATEDGTLTSARCTDVHTARVGKDPDRAECGYVQDQSFVAATFGNFGPGSCIEGTAKRSLWGLAIGKARQTSTYRKRCIVYDTAVDLGQAFFNVPERWFRVRFARMHNGGDGLHWGASVWSSDAGGQGGSWTLRGTTIVQGALAKQFDARFREGRPSGEPPIPVNETQAPVLGFYGYWIGRDGHMDFDNVIAEW